MTLNSMGVEEIRIHTDHIISIQQCVCVGVCIKFIFYHYFCNSHGVFTLSLLNPFLDVLFHIDICSGTYLSFFSNITVTVFFFHTEFYILQFYWIFF